MINQSLLLTIVLAPLSGSVIAGLFGYRIGRTASHWVAVLGVAIAFILSTYV